MRAATVSAQDTSAFLGINSGVKAGVNGLDWLKPPAFGSGGAVRLAFINPANRGAGAVYASDIRSSISPTGETWEFVVSSTQTGKVTLSWPSLNTAAAPAHYQLILVDEVSGTNIYPRTASAYQYQANGSSTVPDVHRFLFTIAPQTPSSQLSVTMQVIPTRGNGGVSVQATPNMAANLTLEVRSVTGRLLRTITQAATTANVPVTFGWNGRTTSNKLVSTTGTFFLTLTAETPDGYIIRQMQPVSMGR